MLEFRKVQSNQPVIDYLSRALKQHLGNKENVLWLVTGGSSIGIAATVSQRIKGSNLANLTVSLTDERYGPLGHPDSNWLQLEQAGFDLPAARLSPVLSGSEPQKSAEEFAGFLANSLKRVDFSLGLIGVGPDSHIAGIKPR